MSKKIILILFLMCPSIIYAGCDGGVCIDVNITEMQIDTSGTIYVQTSGV